MNLSVLSQKISEGKSVDFGSVFNNSIELFKKVWLQGFITILLTFVAIVPFYILLYVPMIAFGIADPESFNNEEMPPVAVILMLLLMPIIYVGIMMVALCLNAAFLRICKLKDLNELGSDDYFFYLKKEHLQKAALLSLLMIGLALLGMLTCGLGMFYLMVPMSLFPAFFAFDKELTAMEILKASFALGNKNWGIIFGLILVTGLLAQLGVLLCFIGVLFTAMLSKIPVYFIYKDTIGFSPNS